MSCKAAQEPELKTELLAEFDRLYLRSERIFFPYFIDVKCAKLFLELGIQTGTRTGQKDLLQGAPCRPTP